MIVDLKASIQFRAMNCPACQRALIQMAGHGGSSWSFVFPRGTSRKPPPPEVPGHYAGDYLEACLVLGDSPKASAALCRRCLQSVLRDVGGFAHRDLAEQIQAAVSSNLPSYVTTMLDAVRAVGNFAAHPIKSQASGEIIDVEPGEAEALLETLETLFDFYFVQPAIAQQRRDAINAKLAAAGKPALK